MPWTMAHRARARARPGKAREGRGAGQGNHGREAADRRATVIVLEH